jgi:hypothetical protein
MGSTQTNEKYSMKKLLLTIELTIAAGITAYAGGISKSLSYGDGSTYFYDDSGQSLASLCLTATARGIFTTVLAMHYGDGSTYFYRED